MGEFPTPPSVPISDCHRIAPEPLISALTFLVGASPSFSTPDPSSDDRKQTISLCRDGIALAHHNGTDRITRSPPIPFDMHIAVIHARRLIEWLKTPNSELHIGTTDGGGQGLLVYFQADNANQEMWIPLRPDPRLRQKVEELRRYAPTLEIQVRRRSLCKSITMLSTVAFGGKLVLQFRAATEGKVHIRLLTLKTAPDGRKVSWGESEDDGLGVLRASAIQDGLKLQVGCLALARELRRAKGKVAKLVYREGAGRLSVQRVLPNKTTADQADGHDVPAAACTWLTESLLRAASPSTSTAAP
jgi:hypothetical protein